MSELSGILYLNFNLSTELQLVGIVFDQGQVGLWAGVDSLSWYTNNDE